MTDLVTWLRQQLDTDEQVAVRAGGSEWEVGPAFGARENMVRIREQGMLVDSVGSCAETWAFVGQVASIPNWRENAQHIAANDPARVLRQVQAHRAILDAYELARSHPTSLVSSFVRGQDDGFRQGLEEAVKALASIYSDRDGYKEEWA